MSRTSLMVAGSLASVLTVFALTGCGTVENGPVIGVPPAVQLAGTSTSTDSAIAAFRQALANQLGQASGAPSSTASGVDTAAEANALASDGSLLAAERVDSLKSLGATTANGLLGAIRTLQADVSKDGNLTSASVDGRSVARIIDGVLATAQAQVQQLAAKIAGDTLIDVLRNDVSGLASNTKVFTLIDPQVHLLIAAGDALAQGNGLAQAYQDLSQQISAGVATDPNYNAEVGYANQLHAASDAIISTATGAIRAVRTLTPAGFPGNQGVLAAQRQALAQLNLANGPFNTAQGAIDQIRSLLGERPH